MQTNSILDIFHLSRIGASAEHGGHRLLVGLACPSGRGVRIKSECGGEALTFWVPEADWCAWLAPQLTLASADGMTDEFRPLLASYTLAPLHEFLQSQGVPGLGAADADVSFAPEGEYWRVTVQAEDRCLPLYLMDTPAEWHRSLLETFTASPDDTHDLALGLGWCFVPEKDWEKVRVGDALALHGMADTLDRFWLHPTVSPGRIRLLGVDCAAIEDESSGLAAPPGMLCLTVEAAHVRIRAQALAGWEVGREIGLQASALPVLRLINQDRLMAFGQLVRLDDGWVVKICARNTHEQLLDQADLPP